MEVHFAPELQAKIDQLLIETGYAPDRLIEDAMAGYVAELAETREMLDSRYDDLKSSKVEPVDDASCSNASKACRRVTRDYRFIGQARRFIVVPSSTLTPRQLVLGDPPYREGKRPFW